MGMINVVSDFDGMGTFAEALSQIGLPAEAINYVKTEFDKDKNNTWEALHGDKNWGGRTSFKDAAGVTAVDLFDATGNKPIHVQMNTSPCTGVSRAGTKLGIKGNPESKFLIDVTARNTDVHPETYMHEITSGPSEKQRKVIDIMNSGITKSELNNLERNVVKHIVVIKGNGGKERTEVVEDYAPEVVNAYWEKMRKDGRLVVAQTLRGEHVSPQGNTHDWRISHPLDTSFMREADVRALGKKYKGTEAYKESALLGHHIVGNSKTKFDPDVLLNTPKKKGDYLKDVFTRGVDIDPATYTRFSAKNVLGRNIASTNDSSSTLENNAVRNRGTVPLVLRALSNADNQRLKNGELSEDGLRYYVPGYNSRFAGKPNVLTGNGITTNFNKKLDPDRPYAIDKLTPEEMLLSMGWNVDALGPIEVEAKAKHRMPWRYVASVLGDAYPVQQLIYMLLQNPVLLDRFTDEMAAAREKFKDFPFSDVELKTYKSNDNLISALHKRF